MIQENRLEEPRYAVFVSLDWADEKHAWSLQVAGSDQVERGQIKHSPESVDAWVNMLLARFPGQPVAVAVEQKRGALVYMLTKYSDLYIYPIHSRSAAQFRAALYPSGAKDDPIDADALLELLTLHRGHLRLLRPDDQPTRLLQQLVEARRKLVDEKTAQVQQLIDRLKIYFPQVLCWFESVDSSLVGALLKQWPTLEDLQKARPTTLHSFFTRHNCRSRKLIEERLEQIPKAIPAIRDAAVIQASVTITRILVDVIAALRTGIATVEQQIAQVAEVHPDFPIFKSFPGAGQALAPRLLAAFGSLRDRYTHADEVQKYSGIAPILVRSGKVEQVHFRWACPKFVRQTFHEWAGHSIAFCGWARAYYDQQIQSGSGHHAAVRALAFKWIRIAFRCWKDRTTYDETLYLNSLKRHGSPLAAALALKNN